MVAFNKNLPRANVKLTDPYQKGSMFSAAIGDRQKLNIDILGAKITVDEGDIFGPTILSSDDC